MIISDKTCQVYTTYSQATNNLHCQSGVQEIGIDNHYT